MLEENLLVWTRSAPHASVSAHMHAQALVAHLARGEALLAAIPRAPEWTPAQNAFAADVHRHGRDARAHFMRLHAAWLYDRLTAQRTRRPRIGELASSAAAAFPGLVPGATVSSTENGGRRAEKEGRDLDLGIFFWGILRDADAGTHLLESMRCPTPAALERLPAFAACGRLELGSVTLERDGAAAHLTIHGESPLNAEDNALTAAMEMAVDVALLDDRVRVCVLRGGVSTHAKYAGKRVFSAGINLKRLRAGEIDYVDFLLGRELGYISKMAIGLHHDTLASAPYIHAGDKPWIAAVDAFAIGGGTQILLAMDHVVAAADSYITLPAAREGLIPGAANLRLARAAGPRLARQMILSGRKIGARDPEARALVDVVAEPGDMDAAIAAAIEQFDSPAVRANRKILNFALYPEQEFRAYMAEFAWQQAARLHSIDVAAAVADA